MLRKKFFFSRVAIVAFALYKALNQVVSLLAAGTLKSSVYPRVRVEVSTRYYLLIAKSLTY